MNMEIFVACVKEAKSRLRAVGADQELFAGHFSIGFLVNKLARHQGKKEEQAFTK